MTATVAPPTGNQFGVLLVIFLVITFATVVVLWVHERRWDRHDDELAVHHEQLATLAGRVQSLADWLGVDVHDARDDSPAALAEVDDAPTLPEMPALPGPADTTPGGEVLGPRGSVEAHPSRVLAECEAKRRIVELHAITVTEDWINPIDGPAYRDDDHSCPSWVRRPNGHDLRRAPPPRTRAHRAASHIPARRRWARRGSQQGDRLRQRAHEHSRAAHPDAQGQRRRRMDRSPAVRARGAEVRAAGLRGDRGGTVSLSPVQVKFIVDSGLFDDAIRAAIKAIEGFGRYWAVQEKRHRVRVQYRRKSRGHR
jgi:hypothetical protein